MTEEARRLLRVAVVAAAFGLVHEVCARVVAAHDLLGAVLNGFDPIALLLGVVLALTRAVLVFAVPGWFAYRIVSLLLERRGRTAG